MKIVLAGAVQSSKRALESLIKHGLEVVGVLGHEPASPGLVSGHARLDGVASAANIPYVGFKRINDPAIEEQLRAWQPDVLFVVGLSQLISRALLDVPGLGCVGFHPTRLPKGRGRAPVAWIVLDGCPAAATFFLMGEGADDGPIFVQQDFEVSDSDDATSVLASTLTAMDAVLDRWLPELKDGAWDPTPQDEAEATWYGVRRPEDGLVDWHDAADYIDRLVRSATRPHPGAFSYWREHKVTIWACHLEHDLPIKGVVGRVLRKSLTGALLVQTGGGLLWLDEYEVSGGNEERLRVGQKLGGSLECTLAELRQRLETLERGLKS